MVEPAASPRAAPPAAPAEDGLADDAPGTAPSRALAGVGWYLLGWGAFALLFATQQAVSDRAAGQAPPWGRILFVNGLEGVTWAALSPLVFAVVRRLPPPRERRWWVAGAYAALVAAVATLAAVVLGLGHALGPSGSPHATSPGEAARLAIKFVPHYFAYPVLLALVVVVASAALLAERELRARRLSEARLVAETARARLEALTMRLAPHFLFNTLHTISALVRHDGARAEALVNRLSELLRSTLRLGDRTVVSLGEELRLLEHYLAIQRERYEERLRVTIEVDAAARAVLVPVLLLQPIVENSIEHAVAKHASPVQIELVGRVEAGWLHLTIRDDGPGFAPGAAPDRRAGLGLANTRARVEALYGPAHRFETRSAPGEGVDVTIELPLAPPRGARL